MAGAKRGVYGPSNAQTPFVIYCAILAGSMCVNF